MKRSDHYHRQMVEAAQRRRRLALWLETYEAMTATRAWHRDPAGFVDGVATHERPVFASKKADLQESEIHKINPVYPARIL